MIKFVATDLDGTLLEDSSKNPTEADFEAIRALQKRNVIFAASSGRQYTNLQRLFSPVRDEMVFICENGGIVMYHGKLLSITPMEHEKAIEVTRDILSFDNSEVLVSTDNGTRIMPRDPGYPEDLAQNWNTDFEIIGSIDELTMPIVKVSIYQKNGLEPHVVKELTERWGDIFNVAVSGRCWLDVTIANKGTAIRQVREKFLLERDEMAAFGDNFNDIEMFDEVGHSFVMRSAHPDVRSHGKYICDSVCGSLNELLRKDLIL